MTEQLYSRPGARPGRRLRLQPNELRAWKAFLDAQASVLRELEADLVGQERLTLAEYDVLVQLALAPKQELRMTDLSEQVRLSRSGITRLVDRLARRGLTGRRPCPIDRRVTYAVLTAAGRERLRRATPTHLQGVRGYFIARLEPDQLERFTRSLEALASR
ncbi:MAG TPA: MarR family transcriptional regulator [Candidatus Limnocylindria bacterium]|nr:MarR family transcriptional regulator [Candidatus Limnocylindria bacterium]